MNQVWWLMPGGDDIDIAAMQLFIRFGQSPLSLAHCSIGAG